MKRFRNILCCVSGSLVALVALAFTVLEATLLVTLDFLLYENPLVACIQLVLRLLLAASALVLGISSLVKRTRSFLPYGLCLLVSSAVMIPFVSNHVAVYLTAVAALFVLSQLLSLKAQDES
jgi:hypothetical protein